MTKQEQNAIPSVEFLKSRHRRFARSCRSMTKEDLDNVWTGGSSRAAAGGSPELPLHDNYRN